MKDLKQDIDMITVISISIRARAHQLLKDVNKHHDDIVKLQEKIWNLEQGAKNERVTQK